MRCCLNCKWVSCKHYGKMYKSACEKYVCDMEDINKKTIKTIKKDKKDKKG